ncbi:VOC family protein [Actinotalea sp. K2]|uniref:VOC family protein n=1 Tax=Actinotalea sp. K2 TaxID=2939438 RepID=UPI002016E09E|nr:VOC family protein [Actinotalea sp. K2]MCL3861694.1 VOC family protein [Actinotalea sp. K2]
MTDLLPAVTDVDAVALHVEDLTGMAAYYREALGLTTVTEGDGSVVLGRGRTAVVVLQHTPGLPRPARHQAGLFHTAVLFPTAADLAAAVLTASRHPRSQFVGSADHLVSNAFYFTDPEGNGIELYHDRDRSGWRWDGGQVAMDTIALDPRTYLEQHLTEDALSGITAARAKVGHVHLQVGDIDLARGFYVDTLGFETTFAMPSALFVSAGGYHHHLAVNTWNSRGAGPRASTLGLGEVTITVPDREDLDAVSDRLRLAGFAVADDGATVRTQDPWLNSIALTTQPA